MNVLSFPCSYCLEELSMPIVKSLGCEDNFHEKCFNKILESQDVICDRCYAPIVGGATRNKELEALVEKISKFVEKSPLASPRDALYKATQCGDLQVMKFLVENGVCCKELINGKSLLWVALDGGHDDVAMYLLDHGAPMEVDYLVPACENGMIPFLKKIKSMGEDPNWIDDNYYSSMHIAAAYKNPSLLKFLLETGDPELIDTVDVTGDFPLLLAVRHGNVENVKLLCQAGADLSIEYRDETVLEIANDKLRHPTFMDVDKGSQFREIIEYLESKLCVNRKQKIDSVDEQEYMGGLICIVM